MSCCSFYYSFWLWPKRDFAIEKISYRRKLRSRLYKFFTYFDGFYLRKISHGEEQEIFFPFCFNIEWWNLLTSSTQSFRGGKRLGIEKLCRGRCSRVTLPFPGSSPVPCIYFFVNSILKNKKKKKKNFIWKHIYD